MVLGLFDKSLEVTLDVDQSEGTFAPGDAVKVAVTMRAEKEVEVRGATVGLLFVERYQTASEDSSGDEVKKSTKWNSEERWIAQEELLAEEALPEGFDRTYTYSWSIPDDALPTIKGEIIQHTWKVVAKVDRPGAKDANQEVELNVAVPAPSKAIQPGQAGEPTHPEVAGMRVELARVELVEGDTLSGQVIVDPRVDIEAREVRLDLVRIETVTEGETPNVQEKVADKQKLAGMSKIDAGESVAYDFSLPVAIERCPTYQSTTKEVAWALRAIISRPLAYDDEVTRTVFLYSVPPTARA